MTMHIDRRSRHPFRARRRRVGCFSNPLVMGIGFGVIIASLAWLGGWLGLGNTQDKNGSINDAQNAFDQGNLDSTIETTQNIWAAQPQNVQALTLLVRALIYHSYADHLYEADRASALQLTENAMNRMPASLEVMTIHAFALQANNKPLDAARFADYVITRQPDNALARAVLGLAYGGIGSYQNALHHSELGIREPAWQMDTQRAYAITLSDLGRYEEAIAAVDKAITINNHLLPLHFERAEYALHMGDFDAATASYFRILAYNPTNVKARLRLCELSSKLRESDTAMHYCGEVTTDAPSWAEGWYHLGYEYFLQGNYSAAQRSFNRCTSLLIAQNTPIEERRFECWYLQGQAAEVLGDCDGLLSTYNEFQAMAASANLPQTWIYPPEGPAVCNTPQN